MEILGCDSSPPYIIRRIPTAVSHKDDLVIGVGV
jgi:hypothetical protein